MEVQYLNFNKYLQNNALTNYWFSCSDDFLCYYAQKNLALKAKKLGVQVEYFNLTSLNLGVDLISFLSLGQLFVQKRLVVVDATSVAINAKFSSFWASVLEVVSPDVNICLITAKIIASQKNTKWFKQMSGQQVFVAIWPLGNSYSKWLQEQVLVYNLKLTNDALGFLQKVTINSPRASINILEKLSICFDNNVVIDLNNIMNNCAELVDVSIFTIINKAMLGDSSSALKMLLDLTKTPKEAILIWAVLNQNFLKAQDILMQAKREALFVVVKKVVRNFQEQDVFMQLFSRHNLLSIKEILFDLWCLDLTLKGVGGAEDFWLELNALILKISGNKK